MKDLFLNIKKRILILKTLAVKNRAFLGSTRLKLRECLGCVPNFFNALHILRRGNKGIFLGTETDAFYSSVKKVTLCLSFIREEEQVL